MRFLIAFVAVLGYASASLIAPYAYGVNLGDAHASAIDSTVVAQDHARAWGENNARAAEANLQWNTEAARQAAETHRDINENAYWNGVSANQAAVAAAQSHAAAASGAAAAVDGAIAGRAGYSGQWGAAPWGAASWNAAPWSAAPYGIAGHGLAAPYGLGLHGGW